MFILTSSIITLARRQVLQSLRLTEEAALSESGGLRDLNLAARCDSKDGLHHQHE